MILTGSNMSGKSTFLRSLGINMVLSGMGSVVCAKNQCTPLTGAGFYAFVRFFV
jgi:DNA mismatch repair ATPase MutS